MPIYSDINISLNIHPGTKDILKKTDVEAVKTSLRNILLGNAFDVPFNPNYGAALRAMLFELQSNTLSATVKRNIQLKIQEFEPRCVVQKIDVNSFADSNEVEIIILFYVVGIKEIQSLNMTLERTR